MNFKYEIINHFGLLALVCIYNCEFVIGQVKLVPEVTVQEGTLRGVILNSRDKRPYYAFQGIRYVEKPERFKIAEPAKSWEGIRESMKPGSQCIQQIPFMSIQGSEDCLFLNVFTPYLENQTEIKGKLAVVIYIHGGAFMFGSSDHYDSKYVLDEDVVLVLINYRLGPFGFLYNEDEQIAGNLGMRDQVEALKWVQRNIHRFGGDPNLVTIMGESAGAASVHYLVMSPMAKGLFHRAILQSGCALNPWAMQKSPKNTAKRFAAAVDCPTENSLQMIDCLRTVKAEAMVEAEMQFIWNQIPEFMFSPVVEVDSWALGNKSNAFVLEHPEKLLASNQTINNVPTIFGINKNEGALLFSGLVLADDTATEELNENWTQYAPYAFMYPNDEFRVTPELDQISLKIRDFYFGNPPKEVGIQTEQILTDIFSDRIINHGVLKSAKFHAKIAPTYIYHFTFSKGSSLLKFLGVDHFEPPTHTDEIPYLFPYMFVQSLSSEVEKEFSKNFIRIFVSFARTGQPEATWGSAKSWPVIQPTDNFLPFYQLDQDTELIKDSFYYRMQFWDNLMATELKVV